jgi:hypothetical protein
MIFFLSDYKYVRYRLNNILWWKILLSAKSISNEWFSLPKFMGRAYITFNIGKVKLISNALDTLGCTCWMQMVDGQGTKELKVDG